MDKKPYRIVHILITLVPILLLCACMTNSIPNTQGRSELDLNNDSVPTDVTYGDSENEAEFISDYSPGEENRFGNIYTNRTLCRQGNYIYHYNDGEKCIQKWKADAGFESAEIVCYIDSGMFSTPNLDYSAFAIKNHIEVVGNYIYLCLQNGETVGGKELRSIVRVRTDGNEQMTLASDCNDCQFRIVDNTLFYLSVSITQHDFNTADYYSTIQKINLSDSFLDVGFVPSEMIVKTRITDLAAPTSWGEVSGLIVVPQEGKYMIGYNLYCAKDENEYYVRYDLVKKEGILSEIDFRYSTDGMEILHFNSDEQIFTQFIDEEYTYISYGLDAYDISLWPDQLEDGVEILPPQYGQEFMCITDDMIISSIDKGSDEGIYIFDLTRGESRQVNTDAAKQIEYIEDGKIYYYVSGWDNDNHRIDIFCRCNLDGSNWKELGRY